MSLSLEPNSNQYGEKSDIENVQNSSQFEEEKFDCQFPGCKKCFTTKFSLKRHYYIHSRRKTFNCEYCDKVFALPQYLREHQYTHTNQQPFVCGVDGCTESFRQRGKLSLHRRTHSNFNKKDYRILNADLNKKNQLLQVPNSLDKKLISHQQLNKPPQKNLQNSDLNKGKISLMNDELTDFNMGKDDKQLSIQDQEIGVIESPKSDHQINRKHLKRSYFDRENFREPLEDLDQSEYISEKSQNNRTNSNDQIEIKSIDLEKQARFLSGNWQPLKRKRFEGCLKFNQLDSQSKQPLDYKNAETIQFTTKDSLLQNNLEQTQYQSKKLQQSEDLNLQNTSHMQQFVHQNSEKMQDKIFGGSTNVLTTIQNYNPSLRFQLQTQQTTQPGSSEVQMHENFEAASLIRNLLGIRQNLINAIKPRANKVQIVPQILVNPYFVRTVAQNPNQAPTSNGLKKIYNYQGQLIQVTQRTIGEPQYVLQMNTPSLLNLQDTSQVPFPHNDYLINEATMTNQIEKQDLKEASLALKDQTLSLDNQNHCNYKSYLICGIKLL
eukprot:403360469